MISASSHLQGNIDISGLFCFIHNVYCDFDSTAAGGRKKHLKTTGTQLSWSQYSWKANRLGDGRTEGEEGWAGAGTQYRDL